MKRSIILLSSLILAACGSDGGSNQNNRTENTNPSNPSGPSNPSNPNQNVTVLPGQIVFEPEGRRRVIVRWNTTGSTSSRLLRDGRQIVETTESFYVDNGVRESASYRYQVSRCVNDVCSPPGASFTYTPRNFDLINVNAPGFDDSFRNFIGVNLLFRDENGNRRLNSTRIIDQTENKDFGRTYGDGVYQLTIRSNPVLGQQCTSNAADKEYTTGGIDADIVIDCTTPASITNTLGNLDIENGFDSMSSPRLTVRRSGDNVVIFTDKMQYESSNPAVARVDDGGVITTDSNGRANIRAYLDPKMYGNSASTTYSVNVSQSLHYRIRRVDFGQNNIQRNGRKVRLAEGKTTLVRVFLQARTANNVSMPSLALTITNKGVLESFTLTCPASLMTSFTDINDYSLNNSCYFRIPENKIFTDSLIQVRDSNAAKSFNITPNIIDNSYLSLVIVPFSVNGTTASIPEQSIIINSVKRRLPFAEVDIRVKPVVVSTDPNPSMTEFLRRVEVIRQRDNGGTSLGLQASHYVAVIPDVLERTILGIAFVDGFSSAIKDDLTDSTLEHELGHNFGLGHAPCGNPTDVDPFWTKQPEAWPGAFMGKTSLLPLYDSISGSVLAPRGMGAVTEFDIMGYCNGEYFSEYNIERILAVIDKNPIYKKNETTSQSRVAFSQSNILSISGVINGETIESLVIEPSKGQKNASEGQYVLYYKNANGEVQFQYFTPMNASDDVSKLFFINLPYESSIELLYIFTADHKQINLNKKWTEQ